MSEQFYDVTEQGSAYDQSHFRYYCQHLVGLGALQFARDSRGERIHPGHCFFCSGTAIRFGVDWYWLTAGHILWGIDKATKGNNASFCHFRLLDHYALGSISADYVPFDYEGADKFYRYSESDGLDFGVVKLREHDRRLLEANGITAISEEEIEQQKGMEFEKGHVLFGLPLDCVNPSCSPSSRRDAYRVGGRAVANAVYVKRLSRVPKGYGRRYRRFVGELGNNHDIGDIEGMSGGPIIGFPRGKPGEHRVVAIQSGWLRSRKITFGCPLTLAADILRKDFRGCGSKDARGD